MELASAGPDLTKLQPLLDYMAASLPDVRVGQGWTPEVETFFPVVQLRMEPSGQAIDFRITRELWDHTTTFDELRKAMEAARWVAEVHIAFVDRRRELALGQSRWL